MSILDQVRKTQFQDNMAGFNPMETINVLLSHLTDKEKDVVKRRFGLHSDSKQTLEEIGKHYGITRERVRQIENLSIRKLKELQELREEILTAEKVTSQLLEQYGGVMEEEFFLENILNYLDTREGSENALLFLADHIFSDNINKVKQDKDFNHLWRIGTVDTDTLKEVIAEIVAQIENHGKPIMLKDLLDNFKNSEYYSKNKEKFLSATTFLEATEEDIDKVLESYLRASRRVKSNLFEEWGLISWGTVQPKKINDKIYIVLKKSGQPMHFVDIAKSINETKFDEKIAYPPTVHNELILDDKYVLVGRGIYALKEWGYEPGNVSEVVEQYLKNNSSKTKDEIIDHVLSKRNVKRSTVYLSLMNNDNIQKTKDGKYAFVENDNSNKMEEVTEVLVETE
ncbi:MAG: sigma factor-like helix-turn-helix DNA-binding protein [Patescibacteria group bacterium]